MAELLTEEAARRGISAEQFALAAMIYSEAGTRPRAEQVGIATAAINRARLRGSTVLRLLSPDGSRGQNAQGRWASTARGPSSESLYVAAAGLAGERLPGLGASADDFFDPSGMRQPGGPPVPQGLGIVVKTSADYLNAAARDGREWVGPIPGVDHRHTMLLYRPPRTASAAAGIAALSSSPASVAGGGSGVATAVVVAGIAAIGLAAVLRAP